MAWEADTVYEQWRDLNFGDWTRQLETAGATLWWRQFGQMEALDWRGAIAGIHRGLSSAARSVCDAHAAVGAGLADAL